MSDLSLGIISTALHAASYAEALEAMPDVDFEGIVEDRDRHGSDYASSSETKWLTVEQVEKQTGVDIETRSAEEMFATVDACVVCSTYTSHRHWVERAAAAGVDVLCEKPLATTAEDARAIVDACDTADVTLGVAMPIRFSEPAVRAREAYRAGEIGDLQSITGTNLLRKQVENDWLVAPDVAGGGANIDHTVHVVNLARWTTGLEIEEVYAEFTTKFHDIPMEDVNVLSMQLTDGTPFLHDGSWSQPHEWDTWGDVTLELIGTDGRISFDCLGQAYKLTRDTGPSPGVSTEYWGRDFNAAMLRDFVDAVWTGRSPRSTGKDGLTEVEVLMAAYKSTESDRSVEPDYTFEG
jgi:predicted dehydrogenase